MGMERNSLGKRGRGEVMRRKAQAVQAAVKEERTENPRNLWKGYGNPWNILGIRRNPEER